MLVSEPFVANGECLPASRLGFFQLALRSEQHTQRIQASCDVRMVWAQHLSLNTEPLTA